MSSSSPSSNFCRLLSEAGGQVTKQESRRHRLREPWSSFTLVGVEGRWRLTWGKWGPGSPGSADLSAAGFFRGNV